MVNIYIHNILSDLCDEVNDVSRSYLLQAKKALEYSIIVIQKENFYFNKELKAKVTLTPYQSSYEAKDYPIFLNERRWLKVFIYDGKIKKELKPLTSCGSKPALEVPSLPIFYRLHYEIPSANEQAFLQEVKFFPPPDKDYKLFRDNFYSSGLMIEQYQGTIWLDKAATILTAYLRYIFFRDCLYDSEMTLAAYQRYQELALYEVRENYEKQAHHKVIATRF